MPVSDDNKRMGMMIRTVRNDHGLTQEQLGRKLGMTRANVANIESGTVGIMWTHVAKIDRLFRGQLLAWNPKRAPDPVMIREDERDRIIALIRRLK